MKNWTDYTDTKGLITQKQSLGGDGGDSLNRTFATLILTRLIDREFSSPRMDQLTNWKGKWRRSWHPNKWYSNYDRTSRDQLTPLVIYLGLIGSRVLPSVFKDHLKRGLLFAYNTRRNFVYPTLEEHLRLSTPDVPWDYSWKCPDFTGPEFWALYIRGFNSNLLRPFLYVFDLHTLIGAIVLRFRAQDDVINHALILEYGRYRMDTLVTKLARFVTPRSWLQARLDRFFGPEIEPPINELYSKLSKGML